MWIAIFDFCLLLLLGAFFLYGLHKWDLVLSDAEESLAEAPQNGISQASSRLFPLWFLIGGVIAATLTKDLIAWFS